MGPHYPPFPWGSPQGNDSTPEMGWGGGETGNRPGDGPMMGELEDPPPAHLPPTSGSRMQGPWKLDEGVFMSHMSTTRDTRTSGKDGGPGYPYPRGMCCGRHMGQDAGDLRARPEGCDGLECARLECAGGGGQSHRGEAARRGGVRWPGRPVGVGRHRMISHPCSHSCSTLCGTGGCAAPLWPPAWQHPNFERGVTGSPGES